MTILPVQFQIECLLLDDKKKNFLIAEEKKVKKLVKEKNFKQTNY